MTLEDLREKIKDAVEEFKAQLEESPTYSTLKERYENLTPGAQSGIIWTAVILSSLFLLSCPMAYWSSSSDNISRYEDTRDLIRDLLRTSHLANQLSGGPEQIPLQTLQGLAQSKLAESRLLPEQIAGIQPIEVQSLGAPLAPENILQEAIQISLKKLNLKQVVDLAYKMQEIHGTVKLAGLEIKATAENDHYFDVLFQLVKFSLPVEEPAAGEAAPPAGRRGRPTNDEADMGETDE